MTMPSNEQLLLVADKLSIHLLQAMTAAGSDHHTTCLSAAKIMNVLLFATMAKNDEFILSKEHAAPFLLHIYPMVLSIFMTSLRRSSVRAGLRVPFCCLIRKYSLRTLLNGSSISL